MAKGCNFHKYFMRVYYGLNKVSKCILKTQCEHACNNGRDTTYFMWAVGFECKMCMKSTSGVNLRNGARTFIITTLSITTLSKKGLNK